MRLSDLDFAAQPSQPLAAWCVLAAGAACLAGSVGLARHWASEREHAQAQESAAVTARQVRLRPVAAAQPTAAQRRWREAQTELAKPWLATLSAVESATRSPVYLLSMNIDAATGAIRLQGEAPTFDQAVDYVQALSAETALAPATLESHADASGLRGSGSSALSAPPTAPSMGSLATPVVRFSALTHWHQS